MIKCNLAVLMAERKLSIQDVADETGLSRTTISALVNETGKGIQFDTMHDLCELLNVSPGDLFSYLRVKCEFNVKFTWSNEAECTHSDEEGNALETETRYGFILSANIETEEQLFSGDCEGDLTIRVDEERKDADFLFRVINPKFKAYIQARSYHVAEYIRETLSVFLVDTCATFEEYRRTKEHGFHDVIIESITR